MIHKPVHKQATGPGWGRLVYDAGALGRIGSAGRVLSFLFRLQKSPVLHVSFPDQQGRFLQSGPTTFVKFDPGFDIQA